MTTEDISDAIDKRVAHVRKFIDKNCEKLEKHDAELVLMRQNCAIHTNKVNNFMEVIQKDVAEIKTKLDNFIEKMDTEQDKLWENAEKHFATARDFTRLETFVNKVFWTAFVSVIGFLIQVIWWLIDKNQ